MLDLLVVCWVLAWIYLGSVAAARIDRLAVVGGALTQVAAAEDDMAGAFRPLDRIPFVNLNLGGLERQLHTAAATSRASAVQETAAIHSLAQLTGLGVILLALFPVLFLYVPARLVRLQEVWTVRRDLRRFGSEPGMTAYLAGRALVNLPYGALRRYSSDPAADLAQGRWDDLAEAELARLGIRRRRAGRREPA